MKKNSKHTFSAEVYKTGINFCVDVPESITRNLLAVRGYIRIKGTVNGIPFTKSLVPVKNAPYRLFINTITEKNIRAMVGQVARFNIERDYSDPADEHPMSPELSARLQHAGLLAAFNNLAASRRKEVLRYLNNLKSTETREKHILRLIAQLGNGPDPVCIP